MLRPLAVIGIIRHIIQSQVVTTSTKALGALATIGGISVEGGTGNASPVVDFNNIPYFAVYCWYRKA